LEANGKRRKLEGGVRKIIPGRQGLKEKQKRKEIKEKAAIKVMLWYIEKMQ